MHFVNKVLLLLTTILQFFFWDCLGEPVPAETFSPSQSHTYPDYQLYFIGFLHLLRFIASSRFNLYAWHRY